MFAIAGLPLTAPVAAPLLWVDSPHFRRAAGVCALLALLVLAFTIWMGGLLLVTAPLLVALAAIPSASARMSRSLAALRAGTLVALQVAGEALVAT